MTKSTPKIVDRSTAADIVQAARHRLAAYLPQEFPESIPLQGFNLALVNIFARYCEIIIQRLNRVPEKNFLAFLDLLGAAPLPPQPSRVPLTFTLARGSAVDAIVPAGTQVAAPPAPGSENLVIFETERELVVTAAELTHLFVRDPQADRFSDLSQLTRSDAPQPLAIFTGQEAIEHLLYIGEDRFLGDPDLQDLILKFNLQTIPITGSDSIDPRRLEWEIWDGDRGIPIRSDSEITGATTPVIKADNTENLTTNGDCLINFGNLPLVPRQTVAGISSRWLRCRLTTRITTSPTKRSGMVRERQLPTISSMTVQANFGKTPQPIAYAFTNQSPIDLSKPFYPFGEKPQFGDTLYLGSPQSFAKPEANVTLNLQLADLNDFGLALPTAIDPNTIPIELSWETWTTKGWVLLGIIDRRSLPNIKLQEDTSNALTAVGERQIRFQLPQTPDGEPQLTMINGIESFWVRVRISKGNYGVEGSYVEVPKTADNPSGFKFNAPTFRPPLIVSLSAKYDNTTAERQVQETIAYNDFSDRAIAPGEEFKPFTPIEQHLLAADRQVPTIHLGFRLPEQRPEFPNRPLSLYFKSAQSIYQPPTETVETVMTAATAALIWEYWSDPDNSWQPIGLEDRTNGLTQPGLLEFRPPATFGAKIDFALDTPNYWLRAYWRLAPNQQSLPSSPQLSRVLLNTILATQSIAIRDELLGSSDGSENQTFKTINSPVLPAQQLDVRELEAPSAADRTAIERDEGLDAIAITRDLTGNPQAIWVRWHQVSDFYGSSAHDRHYVLDRLTGEIRFGNGRSGRVPPIGTGNLRMTSYRTGGGSQGNCPAGSIVQLKTTIPYVDGVTNPIAAAGGAAAESRESLIERAPRQIRHGDRAVTLEDYADLAIEASAEVARAKCFPLLNLAKSPFESTPVPGTVSITIVPRAPDPKPVPSTELIDRVHSYLAARSIPTVTIAVVGPLYIRFDVTATIVPISRASISEIERNIRWALDRFLHPLTGGSDHTGWIFGRMPHDSDFYALIESIPGVDHLSALIVKPIEDVPNTQNTQRFLVYSGNHKIHVV